MSIRGSITIECDRAKCHGEIVLDADDATIEENQRGLQLELSAHGWHADEEGDIWCPECIEAASRDPEPLADDGSSYSHPDEARAERLED